MTPSHFHEHVCPECGGLWSHADCSDPYTYERVDPQCEDTASTALDDHPPTAPIDYPHEGDA